jgi:ribosome-binding ATPase YchF (GTP1/OBG family)
MTTKQEYEDFLHDVRNLLDHDLFELWFEQIARYAEEHVVVLCIETEEELLIAKSSEYTQFEHTDRLGWSGEILATIDEIKAFIEQQKQEIQDGDS